MTGPELSTWVPKQAAADTIGVSTKTVEQLAVNGQLETALYRRPGGGARIRVYNPDDVARLAAARRPASGGFVLPPGAGGEAEAAAAAAAGNGHALVEQLSTLEGGALLHNLHTLLAAMLRAASSENLLRTPPAPVYVDLVQAAAITGLPEPTIRGLIRKGKLEAMRTCEGPRVRRRDLEGL